MLRNTPVLLAYLVSSTVQAMDCAHYHSGWVEHVYKSLGASFCTPDSLKLQIEGADIYGLEAEGGPHQRTVMGQNGLDLALHGRRYLSENNYVVHIRIVQMRLDLGFQKEKLFSRNGGGITATIGRFGNLPAQPVRKTSWTGYKSTVLCSAETKSGFHSALGECLWVLGGNKERYFVLDTLGDPENAILAWKIAKSIRLME